MYRLQVNVDVSTTGCFTWKDRNPSMYCIPLVRLNHEYLSLNYGFMFTLGLTKLWITVHAFLEIRQSVICYLVCSRRTMVYMWISVYLVWFICGYLYINFVTTTVNQLLFACQKYSRDSLVYLCRQYFCAN